MDERRLLSIPRMNVGRRGDPTARHSDRPRDARRIACRRRAHSYRVRANPDPREVETVRVPARQDRRIAGQLAVTVQSHRFAETLEGGCVESHEITATPQQHCEIRSTSAMPVIRVFVLPLAVVQKGEPAEHDPIDVDQPRQLLTVEVHAAPVRHAVQTAPHGKSELRQDTRERVFDERGVHGLGE
jgi:hypothetical protein